MDQEYYFYFPFQIQEDKETFLDLLKDQIAQVLLCMQEKESELKDINSRINKIEKENVELELKTTQIILEEELLAKDVFERYKIDLRSVIMKHLEIVSDKVTDLKDLSSMYMMETEDGPKAILVQEYEFEKRFPGQIKEAKEKYKDYKTEFNRLGEINWAAIEDYNRQKLRYDFLKTQEEELKKSLIEKHNISLNLSEPVVDYLADKGYDKKMGARPLGRKIDELIRVPLSKKVLFERIKNAMVTCILVDDKIEFNVVQKSIAKVGSDGIIEISN